MSALILFDIDGTLVRRAGPHHREALVAAVGRVTGLATTTDGVPVHGMLDTDILMQMMQAADLPAPKAFEALPAITEAAQEIYEQTAPDIRDKRCPGVDELLSDLIGRGAVLGLVTGNLPRIAWRKLERAGLAEYFRFGAFAGTAPTRGGLARRAIEQARLEGVIGPGTGIALIGDAAQDVQAARENGILAIAVRTGITPPEDLEAAKPDLLIDDLTHLNAARLLSRLQQAPAPA